MRKFFTAIAILLSLSACDIFNISLVNYIREGRPDPEVPPGSNPLPSTPLTPPLAAVQLGDLRVEVNSTPYTALEGSRSAVFTMVVPPGTGAFPATLHVSAASGDTVTAIKVNGLSLSLPLAGDKHSWTVAARPSAACRPDTLAYITINSGGTEKTCLVRMVWAIPVGSTSELVGIGSALGEDYFITDDVATPGSWTPLGDAAHPFRGSLRSREGKKITMNVNSGGGGNYFGLFGCAEDAVFDGLTVFINAANLTSQFTGSLAGETIDTVIRNIKLSGSLSSTNNTYLPIIGGLAGAAYNTVISGVTSSVAVSAHSNRGENYVHAGGLAGNSPGGSISNSSAAGDVTVTYSHYYSAAQPVVVGGLVGMVDGTAISSSSATGKVMLKKQPGSYYVHAGGLAGRIHNGGTITDSYTLSEIRIHADLKNNGAYPAYSAVGGLAGSISGSIITKCYAAGAIIEDPANSKIGGTAYAGGLVGFSNGGTVQNSAAIIPSLPNIGGTGKHRIAGASSGSLIRNFAKNSMANGGANIGENNLDGLAKTDAELKIESTYTGLNWDFSTVWKMPAAGYPIFQWQ
jgi:hypothetical protein